MCKLCLRHWSPRFCDGFLCFCFCNALVYLGYWVFICLYSVFCIVFVNFNNWIVHLECYVWTERNGGKYRDNIFFIWIPIGEEGNEEKKTGTNSHFRVKINSSNVENIWKENISTFSPLPWSSPPLFFLLVQLKILSKYNVQKWWISNYQGRKLSL